MFGDYYALTRQMCECQGALPRAFPRANHRVDDDNRSLFYRHLEGASHGLNKCPLCSNICSNRYWSLDIIFSYGKGLYITHSCLSVQASLPQR